MSALVGLFIALTLNGCLTQQTAPAGLDSLSNNVLVWATSYNIPNTTRYLIYALMQPLSGQDYYEI